MREPAFSCRPAGAALSQGGSSPSGADAVEWVLRSLGGCGKSGACGIIHHGGTDGAHRRDLRRHPHPLQRYPPHPGPDGTTPRQRHSRGFRPPLRPGGGLGRRLRQPHRRLFRHPGGGQFLRLLGEFSGRLSALQAVGRPAAGRSSPPPAPLCRRRGPGRAVLRPGHRLWAGGFPAPAFLLIALAVRSTMPGLPILAPCCCACWRPG